MPKVFDSSKPYGEVYGDSKGRRYEQDGVFFGPTGKEWVDPDNETPALVVPTTPPPLLPEEPVKLADSDAETQPTADVPPASVVAPAPTTKDINPATGKQYTKAELKELVAAPVVDSGSEVDKQLNG